MLIRRGEIAILAITVSCLSACGTALYHHAITVSTINAGEIEVGVFDHQQGYSHEWAHRTLGKSSRTQTYATTLTTTAAVTPSSADDARPLEVAFAIPDLIDDGYFLVKIDAAANRSTKAATFCGYGEYVPGPNARTIPVAVTSTVVKGDWKVDLAVDMTAARQALSQP